MLTLNQIYDFGLENACLTEEFDKAGVEVVDNTPDEIKELAIEMVERISGKWQVTKVDKDLQSHFWAVIEQCTNSRIKAVNVTSFIGTSFLKKHVDLLSR